MTLLPETRGTEASQVAFSAFPEPRVRLTAQRSTRRLRLSPKYGSGPRGRLGREADRSFEAPLRAHARGRNLL